VNKRGSHNEKYKEKLRNRRFRKKLNKTFCAIACFAD
jgi:hypothetical protein